MPARQRSATFARPIVTTRRTPTREAVIEAGRAAGRSVLDFVRSLGGVVPEVSQDVSGLVQRVEEHAGEHRGADGMHVVFE